MKPLGVAATIGCVAALPLIYWLELPAKSASVVIILSMSVAAAVGGLIAKRPSKADTTEPKA